MQEKDPICRLTEAEGELKKQLYCCKQTELNWEYKLYMQAERQAEHTAGWGTQAVSIFRETMLQMLYVEAMTSQRRNDEQEQMETPNTKGEQGKEQTPGRHNWH